MTKEFAYRLLDQMYALPAAETVVAVDASDVVRGGIFESAQVLTPPPTLAEVTAIAAHLSSLLERMGLPTAEPTEADEVEAMMKKVASAVGSEVTGMILAIAGDKGKSVDQRQREIHVLENQALGWDGKRWGILLGVSASAARNTHWWKTDRKRLIRDV